MDSFEKEKYPENNKELESLYEADQVDRDVDFKEINWDIVGKRDEERLKKVNELYAQGLIKTSEDMYHAAILFQHGDDIKSFKKAIELSKKAWEMGSEEGKKLYPAAEDRYLLEIGKPQIWGTQYQLDQNGEEKLREPFDQSAKTAEERLEMGVILKDSEIDESSIFDAVRDNEGGGVSLKEFQSELKK